MNVIDESEYAESKWRVFKCLCHIQWTTVI